MPAGDIIGAVFFILVLFAALTSAISLAETIISILCDNAIKYSDEQGIISLNLYKSGKSIVIDMYNTCEYVDPHSVERIFDRFYRADESRSRETGGYGIGLSIAKAIVTRHKGKIRAFTNGTTAITFKIIL